MRKNSSSSHETPDLTRRDGRLLDADFAKFRELCDRIVGIPLSGTVASLNVSVASGICLFETRRQRSRLAAPDAKADN